MSPKLMRMGIVLGLTLTITGILMNSLISMEIGTKVTLLGLLTVLSTPLAILLTIAIENIKRSPRTSLMALITMIIAMMSIVVASAR